MSYTGRKANRSNETTILLGAMLNESDLSKIEKQSGDLVKHLSQTSNVKFNVDTKSALKNMKEFKNLVSETGEITGKLVNRSFTTDDIKQGWIGINEEIELQNGYLMKTYSLYKETGELQQRRIQLADNTAKREKEITEELRKRAIFVSKNDVKRLTEDANSRLLKDQSEQLDKLEIKKVRLNELGQKVFTVEKTITKTIQDQNGAYKTQEKILEEIIQTQIRQANGNYGKISTVGRQTLNVSNSNNLEAVRKAAEKEGKRLEAEAEAIRTKFAGAVAQMEKLQIRASSTAETLRTKFVHTDELKNVKAYEQEIINLNTKIKELSASIASSDTPLKDQVIQLRSAEKQLAEYTRQATVTKTRLDEAGKSIRATGKYALNAGEMIKTAAKAFTVWIGVTTVFFQAVNAIRSGITAVVQLDTSLVNLEKVSDLTTEGLRGVTQQAYEMGEVLGQTGTNVLDATTDFVQAGYNVADAMKMAETAMMLVNVGEVDLGQSTDVLISTLENFNIAASDSATVADKLNEVSNKTSTTVAGLADGLQRDAGILAQTGTTLDESLGLLTAGFTTLRNMEKVSSGLVTIASRLNRVNVETGEANTEFPKLEKSFNDMGLSLLDSNGELKSTYKVLQDLSKVYPTLNTLQKQNINFLVSGTRQGNVLTAILNDFDIAEESVAVSLNSQNSAMKENEKRVDSITGKWNILQSTWQQLWGNTINSDFVKILIDTATALVKVTEKAGLLNVAFTAIIFLLGARFPAIVTSFVSGLALMVTKLTGTAIAVNALSAGMAGLVAAVSFGVFAVTYKIFDEMTVSAKEAKEAISQLTTEITEKSSNVDTLKNLSKEFEKLKDKSELTNEEQKRFVEVQNEIGKILPDVVSYYDENGNAVLDLKADYESLIETMQDYLDEARKSRAENAKIALGKTDGGLFSKGSAARKGIDQYTLQLDNLKKSLDEGTISQKDYNDQVAFAQYNLEANADMLHESDTEFKKLVNDIWSGEEGFSNLTQEQKDYAFAQLHAIDTTKMTSKEMKNLIDNAQDLLWTFVGAKGSISDFFAADRSGTTDFTKSNKEKVESLYNLEESYKGLDKSMTAFNSSAKNIREIFDQINEGAEIEKSTLLDLMIQYPELAVQISKMNDSKKAGLSVTELMFNAEKALVLASLNGVKSEILATTALTTAKREELRVKSKIAELEGVNLRYDYSDYLNGQSTAVEAVQASIDMINSMTINDVPKSGSSSTKSDKKLKTLDDYFDLLNKIKKVEDEISLAEQKTQVDKVDRSEEIINNLTKEQTLLHSLNLAREKDLKTMQDKLAKMSDAEKKTETGVELQEKIQKTIEDSAETSKQWWELEEKKTETLKKQIDLNKTLLENSKEQAEKQLEAIQSIQKMTEDMIKQEQEAHKKWIENKEDELDKLEKQRDYQLKISKSTKEISDLENEIALVSRDSSQEGIAKKLELEKKLKDAKEEMSEDQHDKYIDDTKAMYKEEKDLIDDYLSQEGKIAEDAMKRIKETYTNGTKTLVNELINWNKIYGTSVDSDVTTVWSKALEAFNQYASTIKTSGIGGVISGLNTNIETATNTLNTIDKSDSLTPAQVIDKMKQNSALWFNAADKKSIEKQNETLAELYTLKTGKALEKKNGGWYYKGTTIKLYDNGGKSTNTHEAILHGTSSKPEWIFNDGQLKTVVASTVANTLSGNVSSKLIPLKNATLSPISSGNNSAYNFGNLITINGNVDSNVVNDLKNATKQIANEVIKTINNGFSKNGHQTFRPF